MYIVNEKLVYMCCVCLADVGLLHVVMIRNKGEYNDLAGYVLAIKVIRQCVGKHCSDQ